MALRETQHSAETDLFRQELANLINLRHPLVQLAQKIDWQSCEQRFGGLYKAGIGRPGHPIRLMVALQLLKHTSNLSDEEVVAVWVENPYWQHFCGEQYFRHDFPIDPSLMTGFRKRIGEPGCEFILGLTVQAGLATKTVVKTSLAVVNVDTTVQDKAVAFPTDARLLHKARVALVRQAKKLGINLRQSYERVGQAAFVRSQRYAHARQMNRAKAQNRKLRTYLGRVIRDIERKMQSDDTRTGRMDKLLEIAARIHSQPRRRSEGDPPKLYSVHAPEVECIAKVRREVAYIIVSPAHKAGDETGRSVGRSLPVHASPATAACEATGTTYRAFGPRRLLRGSSVTCQRQRGWDARLSGMVNRSELLQASLCMTSQRC
ncbi:IS5 family transposase [Rhodoferax sediminis]|uniref:IS5 family transposase n=1 Tax=Rhodoferax sediminis TaxID=2509614 RepID=A0A515D7Q6_9BURK|nr:IS5 family transposase [Rhodoferax sediminis]QDL36387.1 IS5 family transposase [Rhodoferax sediminis]